VLVGSLAARARRSSRSGPPRQRPQYQRERQTSPPQHGEVGGWQDGSHHQAAISTTALPSPPIAALDPLRPVRFGSPVRSGPAPPVEHPPSLSRVRASCRQTFQVQRPLGSGASLAIPAQCQVAEVRRCPHRFGWRVRFQFTLTGRPLRRLRERFAPDPDRPGSILVTKLRDHQQHILRIRVRQAAEAGKRRLLRTARSARRTRTRIEGERSGRSCAP